jgi:hypothetical protein
MSEEPEKPDDGRGQPFPAACKATLSMSIAVAFVSSFHARMMRCMSLFLLMGDTLFLFD